MEEQKRNAILQWINCVVDGAEISQLSQLTKNSTIFIELLKRIDPDQGISIGNDEQNIHFTVQHIEDFFNVDVIEERKILCGDELEIGKLLCLILELTLTSVYNTDTIERIQNLPQDVQTVIMTITKMVCDNSQKINLSEIMVQWLCESANQHGISADSDDSGSISPAISPTEPIASSTIYDSAKFQTPSSTNTSPLHVFSASPQALYRRAMVENKRLKQRVQHSEIFLKRQSQFEEQLTTDVETEKVELTNRNRKLVKDYDTLMQRSHNSEALIVKLKEEIEFLQLESHSKEKETIDMNERLKDAKEKISTLEEQVEMANKMDQELLQKQTLYEEQVSANTSLKFKVNDLEEEKVMLKNELLRAKETINEIKNGSLKLKSDYLDQTSHLENEIKNLERQLEKTQACQESLSDTLQQDNETVKLKNSLNIQEQSILNLGHEVQRKDERLKEMETELETLRQKSDEASLNYKQQRVEYMDHINTLLSQTGQLKANKETLSEKIQSAEMRCKDLETQIKSYEESEKRINEKVQQQGNDLKSRNISITAIQSELEGTKSKLIEQTMLNAQHKAKLEILNSEKQQHKILQSQYESLLVESVHLKHAAEKYGALKSENEKLKPLADAYHLLNEEKRTLESKIQDAEGRLAEMDGIVKRLRTVDTQCSALNDRNGELENEISLKEGQLSEMKKTHEEHQSQLLCEFNEKMNSELCEQKESEQSKVTNKRLSKELEAKDKYVVRLEGQCFEQSQIIQTKLDYIEQLEDRYVDMQITQRDASSTINSLRAQLSCSEAIIRRLKNEMKVIGEEEKENYQPRGGKTKRGFESLEISDGSDGDVLTITDLEVESSSNRADEIFQRSRSMRLTASRRQSLLLAASREEDPSYDQRSGVKTYSLRQIGDRRRSLQPRRYMGGRTPPGKRTMLGSQAEMRNFSVHLEEEPEQMDDMEWGRLALLKESDGNSAGLIEDESSRLEELQRRNTLCLPHLKSSYPIELAVLQRENKRKDELRELGKRKHALEVDAPRSTFKKWKTDNQLRSSELSAQSRAVRSDSHIGRNSPERSEEKFLDQPQSMAFEITMEPAKVKRPKLVRSNASANIARDATRRIATPQQKPRSSTSGKIPIASKRISDGNFSNRVTRSSKNTAEKFTRGDNKRSSFSRATHKMASSFREKMLAKNK